MAGGYTPDEIKVVGDRNADRLPPASTVLGMYEYELRRAAQGESLFNTAMIQSAKGLASLENTVKACAAHHNNDRTISLSGVRSIVDSLKSFTPTDSDPKAVLKCSAWLENELAQEAISTEDQIAFTTVLSATHIHEAKMDLQQAVLHLRDDYLTAMSELLETKSRVSKLEDLVRALTLQRAVAPDSPKIAQRIEVNSSNGQTLDLSVSKGQALVPLKPSRTPIPIAPGSASLENVAVESDADIIVKSTTADVSKPLAPAHDPWSNAKQFPDTTFSNEKPLPPVPMARAFPEIDSSSKVAQPKQAPVPVNVRPAVTAHTNTVPPPTPACDVSTLPTATAQTAKPLPAVAQTPPVDRKQGTVLRSKGKTTKWKDPPLDQLSEATTQPKTLFAMKDASELSNGGSSASTDDARGRPTVPVEPFAAIKSSTNLLPTVKLEPSPAFSPNEKTRTFGEIKKTLQDNKKVDENKPVKSQDHKKADENQLPQAKPPQAPVFSSAGSVMSMMRSIAPDSGYVASSKPVVTAALRTTAVPRIPSTFATEISAVDHAASPAPSDTSKASQSSTSTKIAKKNKSVIKMVRVDDETTPTSTVPAVTKQVQVSQDSLEASATKPSTALAPPVTAAAQMSSSLAITQSTSSTSAPKPSVPKLTMNADAPAFKPSPSATGLESNHSISDSLKVKMAPGLFASFTDAMNRS